jgi:hypothetical protein
MPHLIEFRKTVVLTATDGSGQTREMVRGDITPAAVRCYVIETDKGFLDVADIVTPDATLAGLPCVCFLFIAKEDVE